MLTRILAVQASTAAVGGQKVGSRSLWLVLFCLSFALVNIYISMNHTPLSFGMNYYLDTIPSSLIDSQNASRFVIVRPHPHAGARDAQGNWGYIANVTAVRRWMLHRIRNATGDSANITFLPINDKMEENLVCGTAPGKGAYETLPAFDLLRRVHLGDPTPTDSNSTNQTGTSNNRPSVFRPSGRILCALYTHKGARAKVTGIAETWGWRCDGFIAASDETVDDPDALGFGAINLAHAFNETRDNMWQKTRSIVAYMYDNYLADFDYFLLSGDDTHVIVENLRNYLASLEDQNLHVKPLHVGHLIPHGDLQAPFTGGGAGYVLNRVALKMLVQQSLPSCEKDAFTSEEDIYISKCLQGLGILPIDTADSQGRQRFHGNANFMAEFDPSDGPFGKYRAWWKSVYDFWAENNGAKWGKDLVSTQSISFHRLDSPVKMKRHHAIIYQSCPRGTSLGDALANLSVMS